MTTALTLHEAQTAGVAQITPQRAVGLLRPLADPGEIIGAQNATREFVHQALKEGRDYGPIPGTEKKTMLKPGAERTALAFGCYYGDPAIVEQEIDHDREVRWRKVKAIWKGPYGNRQKVGEEVQEGVSLGLYRYVVKVPVIHAESGRIVAVGVGSCSSMESKYVDRPRDSENTILKMAHKRALVAACLLAFGLSDEFTQDVEDMPHIAEAAESGEAGGEESSEPQPDCPKCGGKMWDNRSTKRNAKAPDFKCRDRGCDGVYWPGQWPPKKEDAKEQAATASKSPADMVFPKSRAFPQLEGKKLGEIATEQLETAYTATLEKAPALAQAIADVLEARRLELELNDRRPAEGEQRPDPTRATAPTSNGSSGQARTTTSDAPSSRPNARSGAGTPAAPPSSTPSTSTGTTDGVMPKPGAVGDALGDLKIQRLRGEINELLPRADLGLVKAIGSVVDNPHATAEQLERALAKVTESIRKAEAATPTPATPKAGLADDDLPF